MIPLGSVTLREAARAEQRAYATLQVVLNGRYSQSTIHQVQRHAEKCRALRQIIQAQRDAAPVLPVEPFRDVGLAGKVLVTPSKTSRLPDSVHEAL